MDFDGVVAPAPALLEAARRVRRWYGSALGIIPDAWLARLERVLGLALSLHGC